MSAAPIALFVYNRPWHAAQTLDALRKNALASSSDLYVFCDAPKNREAAEGVARVRNLVAGIDGFRKVHVAERDRNFGLAGSIIDGVTQVCSQHGRIIVLEDDMVTSPYFLTYMNSALDNYEQEERVISIHGYVYPVDHALPQTFFLRGADCWGWATWNRGWKLFNPDGKHLREALRQRRLERKFNFDGSFDYAGMLDAQIMGKNDSWAIRWHASAFLEDRLTLYPGKSLVHNIGNDNSGTNCGETDIYTGELADRMPKVGGIPIEESAQGYAAFSRYFHASKPSFLKRAARKILGRK
jgi:hypothetical protein